MNNTNNRTIYRLIAMTLLLSVALSVASCNTKETKNKNTKISADSPWYDAEIIDFKPDIDTNKQLYNLSHKVAGSDENNLAILSDGSYQVSNWDEVDYQDWVIKVVTLIDRKTKQTARTVDVVGILGNNAFPTNVTYEDGKIFACADTFDPDTGTSMNIEYEIDPVTEKVINTRDINNNGGSATGWILDSYNIGKYRILPEQVDTGTELYYLLKIIAPDETMTEVKLQDSSDSIYDIPVIMPLDETTALIPAAMSREYKFFRLDLKTNKLTKANKGDYSWIDVEQLRDDVQADLIAQHIVDGIGRVGNESLTDGMKKCFNLQAAYP